MDVIRFGRGIRALRQRREWRQADLAREAGVSRSVVARIEQGRGDRVPVSRLDRIATAVGARVVVRLEFHAEELDRLIDASHALLVDRVLELLQAHGWICVTEATFNVFGERGSVDILAFHPLRGVLLVVEVKSRIPEIGNLLAPLDRKVRLAPILAKERGWAASSVARLLVVADESTNRRRIEQHAATFRTAFPVRGWDARRWLAAPDGTVGWSGLWIPSADRESVTPTA
jgi:transcriptional regulator with XRE-family HTH domain